MSYIAKHEILYKDELGQTARIDPGATLSKAEEKVLAKDLPNLVKSKAVTQSKDAPAPAGKSNDGFGDAK